MRPHRAERQAPRVGRFDAGVAHEDKTVLMTDSRFCRSLQVDTLLTRAGSAGHAKRAVAG